MSRYHDILGVQPDASQEEIKDAFRKRALECHPDLANQDRKDAAQHEFVQVREAFEILSDGYDSPVPKESQNGNVDRRSRRKRRSYKEAWRDYRNQKVRVGKDVVENVRGLSSEYETIREKNSMTVPVSTVLGGLVFLYDPMTIYGTGIWVFDLVLCSLIGSVYGFFLGSIWAYAELFLGDFDAEG